MSDKKKAKRKTKETATGDSGEPPHLQILPTENPDDETCMTFVLEGEDHTLGNSLRYMIMKNPETAFGGYTVPHPSERKINLRIQTNGTAAIDVLSKGLTDLEEASQQVLETFQAAVEHFKTQTDPDVMDTA
eukprot:m.5336 g.5336  ORF g.5336 m.5336 type:complete len:132 (+) comp12906_c0_seq1:334-729(+)